MKHIMTSSSHRMLVGGTSVLETEQYDFVVEITHGIPEGSLFCIREVHFYLIIVVEAIHKGKH